MGAWGNGSFENDRALDWAREMLAGDQPLAAVEFALDESTGVDYLEADEGSAAIAAAEVVAGLAGRSRGTMPEAITAWVTKQPEPTDELLALAIKAVRRVLADDSELRELWEEGDEGDDWRGDVEELLECLEGD
jgi:hypothetical protein